MYWTPLSRPAIPSITGDGRRVDEPMMHDENMLVAERMETTLRAARVARAEPTVRAARGPVASARRATAVFFALLGVSVSTWSALVPSTKARLALDDATLGTVLLAFGAGTIVATLFAARLMGRFGGRRALIATAPLLCLSLPLLARAPSAIALAAVLFAFGAFVGLAGVAANAQAIAVQSMAGRPIMSSFHALFSLGGLTGAGVSSLLLRAGMAVETCAAVLAAGMLLLVAAAGRGLVPDLAARSGPAARRRHVLPPMPVLVVGLMTFALYLSEGAVLDWAAVFFHEVRGSDVATAALGYAAFSVAMAAGRLLGDRVVARVGAVAVIRWGTALAAAGFLTMVLAPGQALGLLGCALIGVGASNVVPTLISASARVSELPTSAAVSTVVAMGTTGLIAGPALVGFLAQRTGLGVALGTLAAVLLAVGSTAGIVAERGRAD
jgi:predicted MFS family arabinose efflux permease